MFSVEFKIIFVVATFIFNAPNFVILLLISLIFYSATNAQIHSPLSNALYLLFHGKIGLVFLIFASLSAWNKHKLLMNKDQLTAVHI